MIVYNSPEHAKERQNVIPPSVEEIKNIIECWEALMKHWYSDEEVIESDKDYGSFQRLLFHYENLNHFYTLVGGWEGLEKLQKANEWISVDDALPEYGKMVLISDQVDVYVGKRIKNNTFEFNFIEEDFDRDIDCSEEDCFNSFFKGIVTHWKHLPERP